MRRAGRLSYGYLRYKHHSDIILLIEGTSGPWACPSSRQREKVSRTVHLCPIAHAQSHLSRLRSPLLTQALPSIRALPDGPFDHPNVHAPLDTDASYSSTTLSLSSLQAIANVPTHKGAYTSCSLYIISL